MAHFGIVQSPLYAVYGQVAAVDVAQWFRTHGDHLFSGNIRHFLGERSDVNRAIAKSALSSPEYFWYYNNGITILVEELKKQAIGGNDRSVGLFDCKNVTIVNGAQTVGTLGRELKSAESTAALHARIIVVEDINQGVVQNITRASNTQNRIDARNFVALDPEQERIRTELSIDNISYEYREGEVLPASVAGFDFVEAITVLACASDDISYVALSKGYVGGLYADMTSAPYKALFNTGTSSKKLWSLVQLARRIEQIVKSSYDQSSVSERGRVVHGNRFILHCILRDLSTKLSDGGNISDQRIKDSVQKVLHSLKVVVDELYPDAYPAPLYKNVRKCTSIREKIDSI